MERDVPHVVVRRAILPMGRMTLPRDHDHPKIGHRREHARPRPHDDVVSPFQDLEPPPISRPLVSPDQQPDAVAERFDDRPRGRRNRGRLGNQHDRPPSAGQTAANDSRRPPRPRPPAPAEGRTHRTRRRRLPEDPVRCGTKRRGQRTRPEWCRRRGPRGAGHGMAGQAERGPRRHPLARQHQTTPPQTRPGAAPRARSPRRAERCSARSPTASARASVRRRTGRETRPSSRSASVCRTPRPARAPTRGSAGRGTGPG